MVKNQEINGTEEIGLVTPTPGPFVLPISEYLHHRQHMYPYTMAVLQ